MWNEKQNSSLKDLIMLKSNGTFVNNYNFLVCGSFGLVIKKSHELDRKGWKFFNNGMKYFTNEQFYFHTTSFSWDAFKYIIFMIHITVFFYCKLKYFDCITHNLTWCYYFFFDSLNWRSKASDGFKTFILNIKWHKRDKILSNYLFVIWLLVIRSKGQ